ncbi:unnamed protein product [Cuscuta epithymum]|uniref:Auxin-responsive protein n=1 Tax=Cuscuta epithymum TaxID=186058 RepID=A0AAV0FEQ9_9ASTE|nr:unnamed protein product [Cuscuta epithymum]
MDIHQRVTTYESDPANLKATELRLGLPGTESPEKETTPSSLRNNKRSSLENDEMSSAPAPKAQVVGWPPVRSYRKSVMETTTTKKSEEAVEGSGAGKYVKVSMDGAAYLRKIDLTICNGYTELVKALERMFKCRIGVYSEREGYDGADYAPTYEDRDGDWMLVGDVPWQMFLNSCTRLRVMKGCDVKGFAAAAGGGCR